MTAKMVSIVSLLGIHYLELDVGGLHHPTITGHGIDALRGWWVKCGDPFNILLDCDFI